ncbi:PH domain-containing protein [Solibacillus daqui]|uniref:PH domain-containing protein n=1 Tax=Solibacillus daqui TaxID=2912187 RepID=UPI002365DE26|nr:PH domain-containing protein [Solibacillus daqui]
MVFKSKIDIWMAAMFIIVPTLMIYGVITEPDIISLVVTIAIIALLAILFFGTKYVIQDNKLIIYGGITKTNIDIAKIHSLRPSKNPFSAPAMSIDRIEITFDPDMQMTLVSPKDKENFVKKLLEINPTIKLIH